MGVAKWFGKFIPQMTRISQTLNVHLRINCD